MAKNKQPISGSVAAYMKSREESDLSYLCERVTYLLSQENFLVAYEKSDSNPLEVQFTISKKDISINAFVELQNGNVFIKSPTGRKIDKYKFSISSPAKVSGSLFGEWILELGELEMLMESD